jgi:hypothetical protein
MISISNVNSTCSLEGILKSLFEELGYYRCEVLLKKVDTGVSYDRTWLFLSSNSSSFCCGFKFSSPALSSLREKHLDSRSNIRLSLQKVLWSSGFREGLKELSINKPFPELKTFSVGTSEGDFEIQMLGEFPVCLLNEARVLSNGDSPFLRKEFPMKLYRGSDEGRVLAKSTLTGCMYSLSYSSEMIFTVRKVVSMETKDSFIPLELHLGSIDLKLKELFSLRVGSRIEISDLPENLRVSLTCSGQKVAEGKVAELGNGALAIDIDGLGIGSEGSEEETFF